jgi:solute carrier family 45, member 1/2/4
MSVKKATVKLKLFRFISPITAFVSPTLLKIGVQHQHMTLVWALSPIVGFFLTPLLGSLSDRCHHPMGRRRPFIILLSIGVLMGLLLVPNGEEIGYAMGDFYSWPNETLSVNQTKMLPHRTTAIDSDQEFSEMLTTESSSHTWGIFFTILGTVLLDFDADACQSPSRAYLLDVTLPEDHARGLSTFTILAGLGGAFGYSLGGINWDATRIGVALGGHVRAVFTFITFIFVFCVAATITSFREVPLALLESFSNLSDEEKGGNSYGTLDDEAKPIAEKKTGVDNEGYSTLPGENVAETSFSSQQPQPPEATKDEAVQSLAYYLKSIVFMPHSLRMVCLTNLFCWMAHVCYSLYFTDFVGEAVFNGDPKVSRKFTLQIPFPPTPNNFLLQQLSSP